MIAINLILATVIIGIIYQIKPFNNFSWWVFISLIVSLTLISFHDVYLENRKVEALEKIVVEISKSKSERK